MTIEKTKEYDSILADTILGKRFDENLKIVNQRISETNNEFISLSEGDRSQYQTSLDGFQYYRLRDEILKAMNPVNEVRLQILSHPMNFEVLDLIESLDENETSEKTLTIISKLMSLSNANRDIALQALDNLNQAISGES